MAERLVIVGKGMAATRLVEALSKQALGRYAIAVIGEEPRRAYNRVLLSSLLAGEIGEAELELKPARWWKENGVTTLYGQSVVAIDRAAKSIGLSDGKRLGYERLVLAVGSQPVRLNLPGADKAGVITFRNIADIDAMQAVAARGGHAVVVGGGLLGIEAAYGLARRGAKVTLIHLMDRLMERQLDSDAGALLAEAAKPRGIEIILEAQTEAVLGGAAVTAVRLKDGRELPADLVVFAAGIRPNTALARDAGVAVNRGIVVNDRLQTSDPDIFAIGECAEHRGEVYGLVQPAYEQAECLAAELAGGEGRYGGSLTATNLKVSGVNVFSAGDFMGGEGTQHVVLRDRARSRYRKLVLRQEQLVGAVMFGDTSDALWYRDLIEKRYSIASIRDRLVFGQALCALELPRAAA